MAAVTRRIDIRDLGEAACKLIREVHDSGEELVLVDGDEEMAVVTAAAVTSETEMDEQERAAWARIDEVAARVTRDWTSSFDAVEAVREQRR